MFDFGFDAKPVRFNKKRTLTPVRPNPGVEAEYRRKLETLVGMMHNSVVYWMESAYRNNEPSTIAQDEPASAALRRVMKELAKRWTQTINETAPELAAYFATSVKGRVDGTLKQILKKHGFTVKFTMSEPVRDVVTATTGENVALIKSIGAQYLSDVEQAVMRAVATGRDLKSLFDEIGHRVDLKRIKLGRKPGESDKSLLARTRRRAALIARDQCNKATATIQKERQKGLGITTSYWGHSSAGKEPRPEHVAWAREKKTYDIAKGMWSEVDQQYVWPGTCINCRCFSLPIIPGLEDEDVYGLGMDALAQDKGTWIEEQHPRDADGKFAVVSNGHTKPKAGTTTGKIWDLADKISNEKGSYATSAEVKAAAEGMGLHPGTLSTQFHHWKKFHAKQNAGAQTPVPTPSKPLPQASIPPLTAKVTQPTPKNASQRLEAVVSGLTASGFKLLNTQSNGICIIGTGSKPGDIRLAYHPKKDSWTLRKVEANGEKTVLQSGKTWNEAVAQAEKYAKMQGLKEAPTEYKIPPAPAPALTKPKKFFKVTSPDELGEKLKGEGFVKEGQFNGIDYYKHGQVKVSVSPTLQTWQVKNGDKLSGKGDETNLDMALALGMMQKGINEKKQATPIPKTAPASEVEAPGGEETEGAWTFTTHGIPLPHALPGNIKASLTKYTGNHFQFINSALREGKDLQHVDHETKVRILNLQKAFSKVPPVKKAVNVKRGVSFNAIEGMCSAMGLTPAALAPGAVIQDKGFVSTTHNSKGLFGAIQMNITVPKGGKAIYLKPISLHKNEDETLLPSGTKFQIISIDKHPETGHISQLHLQVVY